MPADRELARLAERKAVIEARIAVRRFECMLNAVQVTQPLGLVERLLEQWRAMAGKADSHSTGPGSAAPGRR